MSSQVRTREQSAANAFDRELDNLIREALSFEDKAGDGHWRKVAEALRLTRPLVRERMHDKDRAATS